MLLGSYNIGLLEEKEPVIMSAGDHKLLLGADITNYSFGHFYKSTVKDQDYHIIINSFGGSAYDLLGIVNRIEEIQSKGFHVTTEIYGYGMSAGAIIFLAGDTRIIHSNSAIMLHSSGVDVGYKRQTVRSDKLKPWVKDGLQIVDDMMMEMLWERTTMEKEEIEHWMYFEDENFMTADEAMEYNLATELR
jgi:ATP-dependent protease ClpP protease subunit